jgi:hypothetical protein
MDANQCFSVVWDSAGRMPPITFLLIPVFFVLLGLVILFGGKLAPVKQMFDGKDTPRVVFGALFAGFSLLVLIGVTPSLLGDWWAINHADRSVVTGKVERFHAMPASGHDVESFTVNGVYFSYSNYIVTSGYNNAVSHGGPPLSGRRVRIEYITRGNDNEIAKLEVSCTNATGVGSPAQPSRGN